MMRPKAALFLFLLAVYLLTYTPRINSSDGLAMFATAESLIRRGALDIEQLRWMELQQGTYGLDGLLYSRKGIGVPLALLPLVWVGLVVPWFGTVGAALLFNAVVTALTGALLSAYLEQLGYGRRVGVVVGLTFGLGTLAWPYSKSLFSDPFSGLLLLGAADALLRFRRAEGAVLHLPALAGLYLGWNVAARYAEAIFIPLFGLLLLYYIYAKSRSSPPARALPPLSLWERGLGGEGLAFLKPVVAFGTPPLVIGLALVAFNLQRYGSALDTGYLPNETFSGVWWQGVVGQLVSPGRGLFLYCPVLLLSLGGMPAFVRRCRPEALAGLGVILIHLLLYGKWFMWHGGYAWGPRFMIPTLPFWAMFLAPVVAPHPRPLSLWERGVGFLLPRPLGEGWGEGLLQATFILLACLSLIPQLLAVLTDFAPVQDALLVESGLPLFDPQTFFDPQYSPLLTGWRFITPATLDLAWAWQGQVNGWLLAALLANVALAGTTLAKALTPNPSPPGRGESDSCSPLPLGEGLGVRAYFWRRVRGHLRQSIKPTPHSLLLTPYSLLLTSYLLAHTHTLPPQPLRAAVAALNEGVRAGDAVITNDPQMAIPFAELYKGTAPVLGLNQGGFPLPPDIERRLAETIQQHQQVWWLPNWLPPAESAVEQTLLVAGFRARAEDFGGQRLLLFALPDALPATPVGATFGDAITLLEIAYPHQAAAGAAFPLELRWRAATPPTSDYHVFIHLVDGAGQIIAQADGQPALWTRPTSTWPPGEIIIDRHGLWLPPALPPGDYQLRVGLYEPSGGGHRLRLPDGTDALTVPVAGPGG
jgi:hypothetical protein